jgi:hypothetical protein
MSLLMELRDFRVASGYKHGAPNGAQNSARVVLKIDDNPPKLMYKGEAKQISNLRIAYARLTHICCLRMRRVNALGVQRRTNLRSI